MKNGILDSPETFEADTLKSACGLNHSAAPEYTPPLAKVLTHESGPAVDWLMEKFGLDLSLVAQLGGHSQPRTHRGAEKFPGFTITYALLEKLEAIEAETKGEVARIVNKANVNRLLTDAAGHVIGCQYEKDGQVHTEHGPVVLATGGFAADFSPQGILARVRPDLDGNEIMAILGIPAGPQVGKAWTYLKELRLDRGPLERDEAIAELLTWWNQQGGAGV